MIEFLELAGKIALSKDNNDPRNFWIGCIGIRKDGALVSARNGAVFSTQNDDFELLPESHAEGRILRKIDKGGIIYVSRIAKRDRNYAMARPCKMCRVRIKSFGIKKVYYTIDAYHYGLWHSESDSDIIFEVK